jgi:hypothetical protein
MLSPLKGDELVAAAAALKGRCDRLTAEIAALVGTCKAGDVSLRFVALAQHGFTAHAHGKGHDLLPLLCGFVFWGV